MKRLLSSCRPTPIWKHFKPSPSVFKPDLSLSRAPRRLLHVSTRWGQSFPTLPFSSLRSFGKSISSSCESGGEGGGTSSSSPIASFRDFSAQVRQDILERECGIESPGIISLPVLADHFRTLSTYLTSSLDQTHDIEDVNETLTLLNSQLHSTLSTQPSDDTAHKYLGEILCLSTTPLGTGTSDANSHRSHNHTFKIVESGLLSTTKCIADYINISVYGAKQSEEIDPLTANESSESSYVSILDGEEPFHQSSAPYPGALFLGSHLCKLLTDLKDVPLPPLSHSTQLYSSGLKLELLALLSAFSDRLRQKDCSLTPEEIAAALASLHNKSSDYREVRMLFGSIIGHISTEMANKRYNANRSSGDGSESSQVWSPELIQTCMTGFKHMDDSNNVILKGVKKMTLLINSSEKSLWTFEQVTLSLLGLQSMTANTKEVKQFLQAMNKKLLRMYSTITTSSSSASSASSSRSSSGAKVSLENLSQGLCGLQSMNSQSNEVKQLLGTLTSYLQRLNFNLRDGERSGHGRSCSHCLHGLRHMNMHHAEVFALGDVLAHKINGLSYHTSEQYATGGFNDPLTLIRTIRSLSNHSSDYRTTTKLLHAIVNQYIKACEAGTGSHLTPQNFLRLLYGFKNASNKKIQVHMSLKQLVNSISRGNNADCLSAYAISNALIGLRGMTNRGENVTTDNISVINDILALFTKAVEDLRHVDLAENSRCMFTAKNLSVALQGLQGLSCEMQQGVDRNGSSPSAPALVLFLDTLCSTLHQQQLMTYSTTDPSSQRLDIVQTMTLSQCSRALYGLVRIHHNASADILALKVNILARIQDIVAVKYGADTHAHKRDITSVSELLELQRVLHLYVYMYKVEADTAGDEKGRAFYSNICALSKWMNEYVSQSAIIVKESDTSDNSTLERRFRKAILAEVSKSSFIQEGGEEGRPFPFRHKVTLNSNSNIEGFDADIILTFTKVQIGMEDKDNGGVCEGDAKKFVYNLEIDGPHHKKPHKESFYSLRDKLLLANGFVNCVRRINLFADKDPRHTKIINKSAREAVVQSELKRMVATVLRSEI